MLCNVHENSEIRTVELSLFDMAGQEDYRQLWPLLFANTDVFIVCYPADASIERLRASLTDTWVSEINRICPGVPFAIVAVHNDWEDADDVPGMLLSIDPEERMTFAQGIGACGYFDIWPCTRIRIDECLTGVSRAAVSIHPRNTTHSSRGGCQSSRRLQ